MNGGEERARTGGATRPKLAATFILLAVFGVPLAGGLLVAVNGGPRGPVVRAAIDEVRDALQGTLDERGLENVESHAKLLRRAARAAEVDVHLLGAIMFAESRGRGGQTSSAGAHGLMQLVPGAARDAARRAGIDVPEDDDDLREALLNDSALNVRLGAEHLAWLLRHRGEWSDEAVLVSYNAGRAKLFRWIERDGSYGAWRDGELARAKAGERTTGALAYARQVLRVRDELAERGKIAR